MPTDHLKNETKYFETTGIKQNCIHEEINSILNSGNACYHAIQNLLSSWLSPKYVNITIQKNHNFTCYFVWVWDLVSHITGRTWNVHV
jgi:hypothetical protein